jgi:hypothetical protein
LHLEVFTGITGRLMQFAGAHPPWAGEPAASPLTVAATDVLNDARAHGQPAHQVIMGDLNTMAHRCAASDERCDMRCV